MSVDYTIVQAPPHNDDAEKSVIGSLLLDPQKISSLSRKLHASHFYGDHNRAIYRTILGLHARHGAVDETLVLAALKESGGLNGFDWMSHLGECAQSVAVAAHAERYADLVIAAARQRRVIDVAQNVLHKAREGRIDEALLTLRADTDDFEATTAIQYRRISCSQLDTSDYGLEYLIDRTLVAGQPCIVAGGKKCLKTSLILDMGISLAMGGCFLGKLRVNRAVRVGIMTGESGLGTIQETCRRICRAAGYRLRDIDNLVFSEDLPRFGSPDHEDALRRFIEDDGLEVVVIDPAYLCMPGDNAGSLFSQGELLRPMSKVCADNNCMMVLAHHTRKTKMDPFSPPELEDIAWSGFQEFARQWLLVGRRERYEPGTGEHRLWLNVGGSAGHSSLWALDISEGVQDSLCGRLWNVNVIPASDARDDVERRKEEAKQQQIDNRIEADGKRIVDALLKYPGGETPKVVREVASVSGTRYTTAVAKLLRDGHVVQCEVKKPNRTTPYMGHKLVEQW